MRWGFSCKHQTHTSRLCSHVDKVNCVYVVIVCSWDYFLLVINWNSVCPQASAALQHKKRVAYHFIFVPSQPSGIPPRHKIHQALQLLLLPLQKQESERLLIFVAVSVSPEGDRLFTSILFAVVRSVFFHSVYINQRVHTAVCIDTPNTLWQYTECIFMCRMDVSHKLCTD